MRELPSCRSDRGELEVTFAFHQLQRVFIRLNHRHLPIFSGTTDQTGFPIQAGEVKIERSFIRRGHTCCFFVRPNYEERGGKCFLHLSCTPILLVRLSP